MQSLFYIFISGGWWLFNQGMLDAVQKSILHFWKYYFNLRLFLQISSNMASFLVFFKFNIRFFKSIFWDLRPKRILHCVSEGKSQKFNLVTNSTVPEMEIDNLPQWISLSYRKILNKASYDLSKVLLLISDLIYWEFLEMD